MASFSTRTLAVLQYTTGLEVLVLISATLLTARKDEDRHGAYTIEARGSSSG